MGREEQIEEREVLASIFPDEIQDISETEFRVTVALDTPQVTGSELADPIIIILNVRYTETYPDEAPLLDITQPPNALKHDLLDLQNDKPGLLEVLQPTIDEHLGMAMVFALVSTLKDAAETLMSERLQADQLQRDMEIAKAEEEENRKFEGEKVTRESFLAWRESFRREMQDELARKQAELEAEERKKRGGKLEEKKLSGKQLWEQGIAGKAGDEDEEDETVEIGALKLDD